MKELIRAVIIRDDEAFKQLWIGLGIENDITWPQYMENLKDETSGASHRISMIYMLKDIVHGAEYTEEEVLDCIKQGMLER